MVAGADVRAWRPAVAGVIEVLHAHFTDHTYPMHVHDSWALLIVDDGAVRYDLDRHEHGALTTLVTLLPPHIPHNGCAASPHGFRKRVLYLDPGVLGDDLVGAAVDAPSLADAALRQRIDRVHRAIVRPGDEFEADSRLALVYERLGAHLRRRAAAPVASRLDRGTAVRLRELLDARTVDGLSLHEAASALRRHPTHLVRAFTREYGMPPHQYLTSRRVDLARRLLLDGQPIPTVAVDAGFYDQAHLGRHFKRIVGASPGRYAAARVSTGSG